MRHEIPPIEDSRRDALDRVGLFHETFDDAQVLVEGEYLLNLRTGAWRSVSGGTAGLLVLGLHQHIRGAADAA